MHRLQQVKQSRQTNGEREQVYIDAKTGQSEDGRREEQAFIVRWIHARLNARQFAMNSKHTVRSQKQNRSSLEECGRPCDGGMQAEQNQAGCEQEQQDSHCQRANAASAWHRTQSLVQTS